MALNELTIHELHEKLKKKEITSTEIVTDVFKRIDAVEDRVRSFTTMMKEYAFEGAKKADSEIGKGNIRPLTGIPIALKDIICTKGFRTTCGSRILHNFVPPYDAHGGGEAARRGRRLRRQDEHGRIRHGLLHGDLLFRRHPQPLGPRTHPRRLQRRLRGGRGRRRVHRRDRLRHGRLHPPARGALRRGRPQADLRPGLALRARRLCLVARPDRPLHEGRGGLAPSC